MPLTNGGHKVALANFSSNSYGDAAPTRRYGARLANKCSALLVTRETFMFSVCVRANEKEHAVPVLLSPLHPVHDDQFSLTTPLPSNNASPRELAFPRPITLTISTPRGQAHGLWRPSRHNRAAVLLLPGSDGILHGPAGLYTELATLVQRNAAVAQLRNRHAESLEERRDGVLSVLEALCRQGVERVALIGWDSGGAVALAAGARSPIVTGVACLAPDIRLDADTRADLAALSPRRLLVAHGEADSVVPQSVAVLTHMLAGPISELALYPNETHEFTYRRMALIQHLTYWTTTLLRTPFRPACVASR
jgi:dienelactone hydrolase